MIGTIGWNNFLKTDTIDWNNFLTASGRPAVDYSF